MQIQWVIKDEFGEEKIINHPTLTVDNIATYAKHNHRSCNGTGLEYWDSGWEYFMDVDEKSDNSFINRKPFNPRLVPCNCVLKTISKVGL